MLYNHDKISFVNTPTPIDYLENVSKDLGVNFYLKRDDLTCLGMGGNKLRKLEYLLKDAKDKGATMLLTTGGAQTNHGRLTAAVAAKYGMKCAIVAVDPYPGEISANLLLDGMMGCPVYLVKDDGVHSEGELAKAAFKKVTEEWEAKGEKVYFIPIGGSSEVGMLGYYDCALELEQQIKEMKLENPRVITTVGSQGTYMGLAAAVRNENLSFHVTGVGISPVKEGIKVKAEKYYKRCQDFLGLKENMTAEDFDLEDAYDFGAYNNPVKEVREAVYYMARKEAIIFDPCYTGKCFAGIMSMIKEGKIKQGEDIIMVHTGGFPGNYTKHHRVEMEKELMPYIHIID